MIGPDRRIATRQEARIGGRSGRAVGQGIVEYALILGLMAVVAIVILVFFGDTLAQVLAAIGSAIDHAG
jgi:Flp pilus assembly pilin Flp